MSHTVGINLNNKDHAKEASINKPRIKFSELNMKKFKIIVNTATPMIKLSGIYKHPATQSSSIKRNMSLKNLRRTKCTSADISLKNYTRRSTKPSERKRENSIRRFLSNKNVSEFEARDIKRLSQKEIQILCE